MKKVLRKMRRQQEASPRTHDRKVITGRDGSSVSGTTRATSSTGHRSSDGGSPPPLDLSAVEESGLGGVFEDIERALMGKKRNRTEEAVCVLCMEFEGELRDFCVLFLCFSLSLSYL